MIILTVYSAAGKTAVSECGRSLKVRRPVLKDASAAKTVCTGNKPRGAGTRDTTTQRIITLKADCGLFKLCDCFGYDDHQEKRGARLILPKHPQKNHTSYEHEEGPM